MGATEVWELYNFTADAHPIHIHEILFEVVNRQPFDGAVRPPEPWEAGARRVPRSRRRSNARISSESPAIRPSPIDGAAAGWHPRREVRAMAPSVFGRDGMEERWAVLFGECSLSRTNL